MTYAISPSPPAARRQLDVEWCPSPRLERLCRQLKRRMEWRSLPGIGVTIPSYKPISDAQDQRVPFPVGAAPEPARTVCPCLIASDGKDAKHGPLRGHPDSAGVCSGLILRLLWGEADVELSCLLSLEEADEIVTVAVHRAMPGGPAPRSQQLQPMGHPVLDGNGLAEWLKRVAFGRFSVRFRHRSVESLVRALSKELVLREHSIHTDWNHDDVTDAGKRPCISGGAISPFPPRTNHEMVLAYPRLALWGEKIRLVPNIVADHEMACLSWLDSGQQPRIAWRSRNAGLQNVKRPTECRMEALQQRLQVNVFGVLGSRHMKRLTPARGLAWSRWLSIAPPTGPGQNNCKRRFAGFIHDWPPETQSGCISLDASRCLWVPCSWPGSWVSD